MHGGIGIFAVSTYNTDYVLVKAEDFNKAANELASAGYVILPHARTKTPCSTKQQQPAIP